VSEKSHCQMSHCHVKVQVNIKAIDNKPQHTKAKQLRKHSTQRGFTASVQNSISRSDSISNSDSRFHKISRNAQDSNQQIYRLNMKSQKHKHKRQRVHPKPSRHVFRIGAGPIKRLGVSRRQIDSLVLESALINRSPTALWPAVRP